MKAVIMRMLLAIIFSTASFLSTRAIRRISIRTSLVLQTQLKSDLSWRQWMILSSRRTLSVVAWYRKQQLSLFAKKCAFNHVMEFWGLPTLRLAGSLGDFPRIFSFGCSPWNNILCLSIYIDVRVSLLCYGISYHLARFFVWYLVALNILVFPPL